MSSSCENELVAISAIVGFWLTMIAIPISIAWVKVARIRHQSKVSA